MLFSFLTTSLPNFEIHPLYSGYFTKFGTRMRLLLTQKLPLIASSARPIPPLSSLASRPNFHQQRRTLSSVKMSIEKAKEAFFNAEHYAVVGASTDRAKFGNRVLRWYKDHGLEVTPVHPKESSIEDISTISDVKQVKNPKSTSLSVITPPKISLPIIKTALQDLSVNAVWLQPGAEDQDVKDWIASTDESIQSKVIYGGPCILVQGESLAKAKGKL